MLVQPAETHHSAASGRRARQQAKTAPAEDLGLQSRLDAAAHAQALALVRRQQQPHAQQQQLAERRTGSELWGRIGPKAAAVGMAAGAAAMIEEEQTKHDPKFL
jgi:hypothetical protein